MSRAGNTPNLEGMLTALRQPNREWHFQHRRRVYRGVHSTIEIFRKIYSTRKGNCKITVEERVRCVLRSESEYMSYVLKRIEQGTVQEELRGREAQDLYHLIYYRELPRYYRR